MKAHIQIVAALHIALGVFSLLVAIGIFFFIGLLGGVAASQGEHAAGGLIGVVAVVLGGMLALIALPGILGGWALLTGRSWGRPLVLVLAAIHIFHVPVGTVIGLYTFWALLSEPQIQLPGAAAVQPIP